MYGLNGKKAIVTGGAHGIGKSIAARLLAEGCDVGIFDLDHAAAGATARELGTRGKIVCASGDVSDKAAVESGIGALMAALGPIDILVNNAGICRVGKLLEMSDADWTATFGINVDGLFHVTRKVAPQMVARRSGAIVNIASWMGKSASAAFGAYCASKFAVVAMTQSLACEIGEFGVRVNAVGPGLIVDTKMRDESEAQRKAEGLPGAHDRARSIPLRRPGYPDDIARAVLFLASDEAAYITGETISVTGGLWND
ncbi:SDR family NAD(P)-dependent oxidoreductase [Bosea sp. ANAM02]|uniref:SDR family NAD(P)-dependent oxidoreductase n=1 Tax=Bosea sp. ANAM02 TaxID=2020412 RepID=UPI00140EFB6B|nr:SDR family NAD(P)-dependent oxidoreductase [Bosea sp. ANAM02]BCB17633.1 beta-ketoacyl-ACP reductase [Bosea sp. ANAM02]